MKYILSLIFLLILSVSAQAKQNYCTPDNEQSKFIIHIFGESYYNDADKRNFLKGIEKLQLKFERGDKIRIVNHVGLESKTELDQCLPGCESKNMIDNLLKNECSVEIAKRDMVKFKRSYLKVLKNALSLSGQEYNVIDHIISLDDFYRGRNIDNQQTLVFHSLLPAGVDPTIRSSFDSNYKNIAQEYNLSKISLPNVKFVNPNRSKNTLDFWEDLKFKGDKSGLKIKFKTRIID